MKFSLRKLFGQKRPKVYAQSQLARVCALLKRMQYEPIHVVDIGANHGGWSRQILAAFTDVWLSLFEPQSDLAPHLANLDAKSNVRIQYVGIGDKDTTAAFTIHDRDDSSSFSYTPEQAKQAGFRQVQIEILKLDTALKAGGFPPPDIIKIDAEGLDLAVLDGAGESLKSAQIVFIEASISNPKYANTLERVIGKMDELGFRIWDFTDLNRVPSSGLLWLVEAVFVRKGSRLDHESQDTAWLTVLKAKQ
jgi:FkbM family methyltransferase